MTITEYRERLAAELLDQANIRALENGASPTRSLDEYRVNAGIAIGLQLAAGLAEDFLKPEDD